MPSWSKLAAISAVIVAMGRSTALSKATVLFQQSESYAVYESIGVSSQGYVVAATWLNEPEVAEVFDVTSGNKTVLSIGDSNPLDHSSFFMDIAQAGTTAIVAKGAPQFGEFYSTFFKFDVSKPASANPAWNVSVAGELLSLAVSADGSTIAVCTQDEDATTRVRVFDGETSSEKLEFAFALPEGSQGGLLAISADGSYVAVLYGSAVTQVVSLSVLRGAQRHSANVTEDTIKNSPGQAFDISYDGKYIVAGQATSLSVFELIPGAALAYKTLWTAQADSFYVSSGCIAFSPDSHHVAVGYQSIQGSVSLQPMVRMFPLPSSTPSLNYTFPLESGSYPNWPTQMAVSSQGKYASFSSWGAMNQQPGAQQLQVFYGDGGSSSAAVAGQVFTPGSMFGTGIAMQASGASVVACAAGKHVHATVLGNGGDLVCVSVA
jgi:hypothetical protein